MFSPHTHTDDDDVDADDDEGAEGTLGGDGHPVALTVVVPSLRGSSRGWCFVVLTFESVL